MAREISSRLRVLSGASLAVLALVAATGIRLASAQEMGTTASLEYSDSSEGSGGFTLPSVFPVALKRNLVTRFSVGEVYNNGLQQGSALPNANDLYSEITSSFAYNIRRSRSESVIDYRLGARHYNHYNFLGTLTHDLGASHIRQLSRNTNLSFNYRYGSSPDYEGSLIQEDLAREFGIFNPLPVFGSALPGAGPSVPAVDYISVNPLPGGVTALPLLTNPLPTVAGAGDALQTTHSLRMTHRAGTSFTYARSYRTNLYANAGFRRTRYENDNLFGSDDYNLSVGAQYVLSPRTSFDVSYRAGFNELDTALNQTLTQSAVVSVRRQLTPRTSLSVSAGPMFTRTRSQQAIALSPLLSNILGQNAILSETTSMQPSWTAGAGIGTEWKRFNLSLNYSRSVSSSSGLGGASLQQNYSAGISRAVGRRTSFSIRASYYESEFLGTLNSSNIAQRALSGTFTRQMAAGMDLVAFVNYSRIMRGVESLFRNNHTQAGLRLQINLPRVRQM